MKRKNRDSLSKQFLLYLIPGIIAICILGGIFIGWLQYDVQYKRLLNKGEERVDFYAGIIDEALWNMSENHIRKIIYVIMKDDEIEAVVLKNEVGTIVAASGMEFLDNVDSELIFEKPVFHKENSERIGSLGIYFTDKGISKTIWENMVIVSSLFLIFVVSLSLIHLIFQHKIIIIPMRELLAGIKKNKGIFNAEVLPVPESQEFAEITESFNDMILFNRQAVKNLEETGEYLRAIFDTGSSLLCVVNSEGFVIGWNSVIAEYLGISRDEAEGKHFWLLHPVLKRYKNYLSAVILNSSKFYFSRVIFDGIANRIFNVYLFPIKFGRQIGLVIRMDDITDLEKKDEQLRQMQKMEVIGMIAGGIAHDLNNVLSGITGPVSMLNHMIQKESYVDAKKLKSNFDLISNSAKRVSEMVTHLFYVSKKKEPKFIYMDLNNSVRNTLKFCKNSFDKSIEIKAEYPEKNAFIKADPTQIEQVVLNLLINASQAMTVMRENNENKGGTIYVKVDKVHLGKYFNSIHNADPFNGYYHVLKVTDEGVGMDKETVKNIFEPLYTKKRKKGGSGMGLFSAYTIIDAHKGFINVDSEPGVGSSFFVYIPVAEGKEFTDKDTIVSNNFHKGQGNILLVDDEPILIQAGREIMEILGYDVITAKNGQEAVDIFKREHDKIDAVVMDVSMPVKNGIDASREIKSIDPEVVIVLSSGHTQEHVFEQGNVDEVDTFIQKPYTMRNLSDTLHKYLKK
ncbi:MAG: hypothetical protein CSB55_05275 [Candidatus Cloacimonadota bacterium]|nr:MAG: hypothetical protein CSB55_05275 [Candidatus Cloacimonadota bacterium]